MNTRRGYLPVSIAAVCLLFAGCDDSKSPLSDPQHSKPDARLAGVWRLRGNEGEVTYYHIGPVGDKVPDSVLWVVAVSHATGGQIQVPDGLLIFPTTLGDHGYLNVAGGSQQRVKLLKEKGWQDDSVGGFLLLKYKVDGDALLVWAMDGDAKKKAIEAGNIKGVIEKQKFGTRVRFTDTTENLDRFIVAAGDGLFSKEAVRLERVK